MATTVQQIIEAAYARSSANDPGKSAEDAELIGFLNRMYQALYAAAALASPEQFLTRVGVTLVDGVGPLPTEVLDIRRIQSAGGIKVNLSPVEELDRLWQFPPVVFQEGNTLVSRGGVGDPGPADVLTTWLVQAAAALTALTDTIDTKFASRYLELLVLEGAVYLSTKDAGRDADEYQELKAALDTMAGAFAKMTGISFHAINSAHASKETTASEATT